jgi:tRNA(adenine34) deaminase
MELAIQQALQAFEAGELPFGAVVVRDGKVVSRGRCEERGRSSVLAHAEALAIDRACRKLATTNLADCTIYCTNEPCAMCAAAIFQAKVRRVVIGASRKDLTFLRSRTIDLVLLANDSGFQVEIIRDVSKEQILAIFTRAGMV